MQPSNVQTDASIFFFSFFCTFVRNLRHDGGDKEFDVCRCDSHRRKKSRQFFQRAVIKTRAVQEFDVCRVGTRVPNAASL